MVGHCGHASTVARSTDLLGLSSLLLLGYAFCKCVLLRITVFSVFRFSNIYRLYFLEYLFYAYYVQYLYNMFDSLSLYLIFSFGYFVVNKFFNFNDLKFPTFNDFKWMVILIHWYWYCTILFKIRTVTVSWSCYQVDQRYRIYRNVNEKLSISYLTRLILTMETDQWQRITNARVRRSFMLDTRLEDCEQARLKLHPSSRYFIIPKSYILYILAIP